MKYGPKVSEKQGSIKSFETPDSEITESITELPN